MKKLKITGMAVMLFAAAMLSGCGDKIKLDPDNPVSLTVWHYYNGTQQATFDSLLEEFNASVGKEQGIYIEGYSYGSVSDLESAIQGSLKGEVGAGDLPDIFSSYADTAYSVQKQDKLVDLTQYFTDEELDAYVDDYIREGYFNQDDALYLLPVAKSTEIMMINATDWEPFAKATGSTLDELATTEGVTEVAERYYDWTDSLTPDIPDDGKAFYGRDSMSNYFIIGMRQMGKEIFEVKNGKVTLNLDKDLIRRLWDNYYVPYVSGYFGAYGKFRSDDVKTGDILAYTGSTSSALYFPDSIENGDDSYPISCSVLQSPLMEGGENYRVQQGAGMAVTKSDSRREYASCIFLKWFTQKEQNLRFVCDSAYLPVQNDANNMDALDQVAADYKIEINQKAYDCLDTILTNFKQTDFYTPKSFDNGYSVRKILDYSLSDRAKEDRQAVEDAIAAGTAREEALQPYLSDNTFDSWYQEFCTALNEAAEAAGK